MSEEQRIDDLLDRGIENIISSRDELKKKLLSGEKLNVYLGIDPTATRIHLGHAFNLRKLQIMAELGHNVTFLIGDFTALVGDTSDKNDERPILTPEEITANFEKYQELASKFLDFDKVTLRRNSEWLKDLTFGDVLKLTREFSVNDFTSRELIRNRLDEGKRVGLAETMYPLMQGYDSYTMDTDIQFGATDQTFNMQAGRTLQKRLRDKESFVVASGYLPGTDGRKMSKSWGNAIWLDDPADEVFGKVMRVSDDVVRDYFVLGTNLSAEQIDTAMNEHTDNPMELKKVLARQIVHELNGENAISDAESHFVATVQNKEAGEDVQTIKVDSPLSGHDVIEIIVEQNLAPSKSEARRLIEQNAVRLDDEVIHLLSKVEINGTQTLRVGKRRYIKLQAD